MPIPTDTLRNIKQLNKVFAFSTLAVLALVIWAIAQDHDRQWRGTQEEAQTWEFARQPGSIQPGGLSRVGNAMRDLPLVDFLRPSQTVHQVVLPDIRTDLAFKTVDTIDRCMTCHVNATNPSYTRQNMVIYLEGKLTEEAPTNEIGAPRGAEVLPEFWNGWSALLLSPESLAKARRAARAPNNLSQALRAELKATLSPSDAVMLEERYRIALIEALNHMRAGRGLQPLSSSPALLAHPRLDLYLGPQSKHPFETVGCTSCHGGSGQETDFVLAAHTPRPIWVDANTGAPVLTRQLQSASDAGKSQGYTDPAVGIAATAITQKEYWAAKYPSAANATLDRVHEQWDSPMRGSREIQANCVRCHQATYDIEQEAPIVCQGRKLFTTMGCVNCHQTDSIPAYEQRRIGPDLRHIDAKLSREFVNAWIWSPRTFRPSTKMPHYFMLENNSSPQEIKRTRQEARAITEYLFQAVAPKSTPEEQAIPESLTARLATSEGRQRSYANGRLLFKGHGLEDSDAMAAGEPIGMKAGVGCIACHTNLNDWTSLDEHSSRRGGEMEPLIVVDLEKRAGLTRLAAERNYAAMTPNQRQKYALENMDEPSGRAAYADGTPRPIFLHHGPELSAVGTELLSGRSEDQARQWLFAWLKNPGHINPDTIMPNLRLSDEEAVDLTTYLLAQTRDKADAELRTSVQAYSDRLDRELADLSASGITMQARISALAKDSATNAGTINALKTRLAGLPAKIQRTRIANESAKVEQRQLQTILDSKPPDEWKEELTPPDGQTLRELTALMLRGKSSPQAAYEQAEQPDVIRSLATSALAASMSTEAAADQVNRMDLQTRQMVYLGSRLIAHYGCMQCHQISGAQGMSSPGVSLTHWGQKRDSQLDFGTFDPPNEPTQEQTSAGWLAEKLHNPRIFDRGRAQLDPDPDNQDIARRLGKPYEKLCMPAYSLSDDQVQALTTFVLGNRDPLISERLLAQSLNPQARSIAKGRAITEMYNCAACHQIEQNSPAVAQYFNPAWLSTYAPPPLHGEGSKVQFDWLHDFLQRVEPLRPLPKIRMPTFPWRETGGRDDLTDVIDYFHAASAHESDDLKRWTVPIVDFIAQTHEGGSAEDWISAESLAEPREKLVQWAKSRRLVVEVDLDPSRNSAARIGQTYQDILFKARFLADLYDSPYPFTGTPPPAITDAEFGHGEKFFQTMQCLNCHAMDPAARIDQTNAKAPNLSLAHERLQRRWLRRWVQEPGVIQPGTNMPPVFTGLAVGALDGQPYAQAMALKEPWKIEATNQFGRTVDEQKDLLLDFLYAAGKRGYATEPKPELNVLLHLPAATRTSP